MTSIKRQIPIINKVDQNKSESDSSFISYVRIIRKLKMTHKSTHSFIEDSSSKFLDFKNMAFRNDHDRMIYIICTVWDNDSGKKTILIKSPCHLKHTAVFKQWDKNKIVYYSNNMRVCSEINGIISSSISCSLCGFHCLSILYICQSPFNFRPYTDNWWAASW